MTIGFEMKKSLSTLKIW